MEPSRYLHFAGSLLTYFLQVSAGFGLCLIIARLLGRPYLRFRTWLGFLFLAAIYWLLSLAVFAAGISLPRRFLFGAAARTVVSHGSAHLSIPARWTSAVVLAGTLLCWGYLAGVAFLFLIKAWKHIRLRMLLHHSRPAPRELEAIFEVLCRDLGVRRCRLAVVPGLTSPATAFWWRPRILLPPVCQHIEDAPQLVDILSHELSHIVRRDYLWGMLSDLVCCLLFFHPALWRARGHMRKERELACDLAVITARPDHRADYATSLARFVRLRMLEQSASYGVDFAASASFLALRIRCILAEPVRTPRWKKFSSACAGAAFIAIFAATCPLFSVLLDFAGQPHTMVKAVNWLAPQPAPSAHRPRLNSKIEPQQNPALASYPDDLTSLRVQPRNHEDTISFARDNFPTGGANEFAPNDKPVWQDSSPASPSYAPPTMRSVVLSTIGGITSERSERGHGRDPRP